MKLLHQIGNQPGNWNFNTLEEVLLCTEPLSFDGVYMSVYEHYKMLKGKEITFFYSGKYLGGNNSFDVHKGQPLSKFCTLEQIKEMAEYLNAKIGYHGWEHLNCTTLSVEKIAHELTKGKDACTSFAWPYGEVNQRCIRVAQSVGYTDAWSVSQGDGSQFQKQRTFLNHK